MFEFIALWKQMLQLQHNTWGESDWPSSGQQVAVAGSTQFKSNSLEKFFFLLFLPETLNIYNANKYSLITD